jgi:hypothetical protein
MGLSTLRLLTITLMLFSVSLLNRTSPCGSDVLAFVIELDMLLGEIYCEHNLKVFTMFGKLNKHNRQNPEQTKMQIVAKMQSIFKFQINF